MRIKGPGRYRKTKSSPRIHNTDHAQMRNQNALIERNTAALSNQINMQTCEIKQAISTDGQATRALINDLRLAEVQEELASTKAALAACQASANNASQLQTAVSTILSHCGCGGNGNGNGNGNGRV